MVRYSNWPRYAFSARAHLLSDLRFRLHLLSHVMDIPADRWQHYGHIMPANALYGVLGGDGWYEDAHRRGALAPGRLYLLPAQAQVSVGCATHITKMWLAFDLELFVGTDLLQDLQEVVDLGPFTEEECARLETTIKTRRTADWLLAEGWCLERLNVLGDRLESLVDRHAHIYVRHRKLLEYVTVHLDARLRVAELADHVGLSVPHLSRVFHADFGVSLKEYLETELNRRAQALLSFEDLRVKEVAAALHFPSQQTFARFFRRRTGITPSSFRSTHRLLHAPPPAT